MWKGFCRELHNEKRNQGNPPSEVELPIGFPCVSNNLHLDKSDVSKEYFTEISSTRYITRQITKKHNATYPIRLDKMVVENGFLAKPCRVYSGWANVKKLKAFIQNECKPIQDDDGSALTFDLSERGVIYYKRERENARNIFRC